jgi:hypothetical protein
MEPPSDIENPVLGKVENATWEIAYSKGLATGLLMGFGIGVLLTIFVYWLTG